MPYCIGGSSLDGCSDGKEGKDAKNNAWPRKTRPMMQDGGEGGEARLCFDGRSFAVPGLAF